MKASLNNFLYFVKNIVMGGGLEKDNVTPRNDSGYKVDFASLIGDSVLAASVTRIADAEGFPVLNAAATITAVAAVLFEVPRDYDEATDELFVEFTAKMGGATDVPTLTLAVKTSVLATAAVTLTASTSATTAALSATAQKFSLKYLTQGIKRGMRLGITITSGAHTTDAIQLQTLNVVYRSTLVSYNETDSASGKPETGNSLR